MRFWAPDHAAPHLVAWWEPLVRAGRRALDEKVPWLILVDEWELAGRYVRRDRPDVWVYCQAESGGELYGDDSGQAYRFIPNRSGPSASRRSPCGRPCGGRGCPACAAPCGSSRPAGARLLVW